MWKNYDNFSALLVIAVISLFVPKDEAEETLLLLLISESIVRCFRIFLSLARHLVIVIWFIGVVCLQRVMLRCYVHVFTCNGLLLVFKKVR